MQEPFPELIFKDDLLPEEQVLWTGQPDPSVIFSRADIFLVPFSLMWGGFAIFWELAALGLIFDSADRSGAPLIFPLFGIPFVLIGLYFMVGRFFCKVWVKKRTFYGVTNRRVLMLKKTRGRYLEASYIDSLPTVNKSVRRDGVGTIVFGNASPFVATYQNTGMDWFGSYYGQSALAFYDIRDAQSVYELVNRVRSEQ